MTDIKNKDKFVQLTQEGPRNATTTHFHGTYNLMHGEEYFDRNEFKKKLQINILEKQDDFLKFEIINVDASLANAFRRIMISEVPTIAIETVTIFQNTGIIADEILCHRLGLIPFQFDADLINYREKAEKHNEQNCFCFKLHVKCKTVGNQKTMNIYSKDLIWVPLNANQKNQFQSNPPKVVDKNILITKLAVGQEIELICFLEKGIGKTHAKWSPVSTATYRMKPVFIFNDPEKLTKEETLDLINLCPRKVFDIEDGDQIVAKNVLNCSSCRACIEKYPKKVVFNKIKHHFIFSIESTGCFPAHDIFLKAVRILKQKCIRLREQVQDKIE